MANEKPTETETLHPSHVEAKEWVCDLCGSKFKRIGKDGTYLGDNCPVCNSSGFSQPQVDYLLKVFTHQRSALGAQLNQLQAQLHRLMASKG
jgi:hypothetical protein